MQNLSKKKKSFGQKVLQSLRLEKPAIAILNKITARYEYPYLKGVESRGETVYKIMKSHLKSGDNFLDIMCGYSPLAGPLLKSGYQITGFDDNRTAVKDLTRLYPGGKWVRASYASFKQSDAHSPFSVFLLLGAFELCSQSSFTSSIAALLNVNQPRLFLLETNKSIEKAPTIEHPFVEESAVTRSAHLQGYNSMMKLLIDRGYKVVDVGQYDAQLKEEWATIRIYAILEIK